MPSFEQHVNHAKSNLSHFKLIECTKSFDWQVVVCYYACLHLMEAHIASTSNQHYSSHVERNRALKGENGVPFSKINERIFDAYLVLEKQSRKARYLCDIDGKNDPEKVFNTFEVHAAKALRRCNEIMKYFETKYKIVFNKTTITNRLIRSELKTPLEYFVFEA